MKMRLALSSCLVISMLVSRPTFAAVTVHNEAAGTFGQLKTVITGQLNPANTPLVAASLVIRFYTNDVQAGAFIDDGAGHLTGSVVFLSFSIASTTGSIDYDTGAWRIVLASPGTLTTGTVQATYQYFEASDTNRSVMGATDEYIGVAPSNYTAVSGLSLIHVPVVPGSITGQVGAAGLVFHDAGNGRISGYQDFFQVVDGRINYDTGDMCLFFPYGSVTNSMDISVSYLYTTNSRAPTTVIVKDEALGMIPPLSTVINLHVDSSHLPVLPGSVFGECNDLAVMGFTDDGAGNISGYFSRTGTEGLSPVSGTIVYQTGEICMTLTTPGVLQGAPGTISYLYDASLSTSNAALVRDLSTGTLGQLQTVIGAQIPQECLPIIPGTLTVKSTAANSTLTLHDNGQGSLSGWFNLVGSDSPQLFSGRINYETGSLGIYLPGPGFLSSQALTTSCLRRTNIQQVLSALVTNAEPSVLPALALTVSGSIKGHDFLVPGSVTLNCSDGSAAGVFWDNGDGTISGYNNVIGPGAYAFASGTINYQTGDWAITLSSPGFINPMTATATYRYYLDTDSDGIPDWAELKSGTNPTNANDRLHIDTGYTDVVLPDRFTLAWTGKTGIIYQVRYADSLQAVIWNMPTNTWAGVGPHYYTDMTIPMPTGRFYRVVVE